jgi:hypothetical protein
MATLQITETGVRADVSLRRDANGAVRLTLLGKSVDATGNTVRGTQPVDITDDVSQAVRDGAETLMTNIENRLKSQWNIP